MFLILLLAGSISLSLTMVKSGLIYDFGMGFWGANAHDGIWHIALINQLAKLKFIHPSFAGENLINYHLGFDLLGGLISRVLKINAVNLYFQIFPPILAVLIGLTVYRFVLKWTGSKISSLLATFFVYFGGSFGWLANLLRGKLFAGESIFWANQAISTLINPPYALSLIILFLGMKIFLDLVKKFETKKWLVLSFLWGILIQIKVYAGIIVLLSLFSSVIYFALFDRKKTAVLLKLLLLTSAVSLVVFLPFNYRSGSLLVFSPLWFPRSMIFSEDRLFWPALQNARVTYSMTGQWLKWFMAELLALMIFVVGNLGTRIIGFVFVSGFLKKLKKLSETEFFVIVFLFFSFTIPLLFIQKGNSWNSIQFFYYFQLFLGILAGVFLGKWLETNLKKSKPVSKILIYAKVVLILGLTLPTSLLVLKDDFLGPASAVISKPELEALRFLSYQPEGYVLTYPSNIFGASAYVSALSGKQTYFEDETNLEISGYNWRQRRDEEIIFFTTDDQKWAREFIKEKKIKYLYLAGGQKVVLTEKNVGGEEVFENDKVRIFVFKW